MKKQILIILFFCLIGTAFAAAGADVLQVSVEYAGLSGPMRNMEFPYSDDFFRGDPEVYDHQFAQGSLGLELASFPRSTDMSRKTRTSG